MVTSTNNDSASFLLQHVHTQREVDHELDQFLSATKTSTFRSQAYKARIVCVGAGVGALASARTAAAGRHSGHHDRQVQRLL